MVGQGRLVLGRAVWPDKRSPVRLTCACAWTAICRMAIGGMPPPLVWPGMVIEDPIGTAMPIRNCCCMNIFCCAKASCSAAPNAPPGAVAAGAVAAGVSHPDALFLFLPPCAPPASAIGRKSRWLAAACFLEEVSESEGRPGTTTHRDELAMRQHPPDPRQVGRGRV